MQVISPYRANGIPPLEVVVADLGIPNNKNERGLEVQSITPRVVDKYIQTLQKMPSVSTKTRKARTVYVTNQTIEKIIKILRCAFTNMSLKPCNLRDMEGVRTALKEH